MILIGRILPVLAIARIIDRRDGGCWSSDATTVESRLTIVWVAMIQRLLEAASMLDHDPGFAQDVDVLQRIASDGDHVRELAFGNRP